MKKILTIIIFNFICSFSFGYSISNKGLEYIKKYEKCSLTAYWDSNGYSIGYGHHGKDVKRGMKISKSQADKYFREDIKWVNEAINRLLNSLPVKHKFSQNFIDGLGDLIYNCGEGGVCNSEFYKRLKNCRKNNKNDMNFTIAAIKNMKITSPGHIERRYNTHKNML